MRDTYNRGQQVVISRLLGIVVVCAGVTSASAQSLPAEPVTFGDGRVVVGGEISATVAPDDTGFFNYSDYEHSTLREFRASASLLVRATDRISVLVRGSILATDTPANIRANEAVQSAYLGGVHA